MRTIGLLILALVFQGCEKVFFSDEPENTPTANFEIFWNDFDRYYGQFDIRNINWDSVYSVYRPEINDTISDTILYNVFNNMVHLLKDPHVNLNTPIGDADNYYLVFPDNYQGNQLINPIKYISYSPLNNFVIKSGAVNSYNIGYVNITTFISNEFGEKDSRYYLIDEILELYKDKDGIIIDVRGNGGGNSSNVITVASRFADKKYVYYKQRYKNGPGKNDFSEWVNFSIDPQGAIQFTKPVVVLISRYTFSAAELFVSAMSVFPHVTLIGDTTAGGIGNPVYREMLNGWTYRLSTSVGAMADGSLIDGQGIVPHITIVPGEDDLRPENSRDPMLEKGIEVIVNSENN